MAAVRAVEVRQSESFKADIVNLRENFPEIDLIVTDFGDVLNDYSVPHTPVQDIGPGVFARRVDFPPRGSAGVGRLLITYLETIDEEKHKQNPMTNALKVFTLLTITERP